MTRSDEIRADVRTAAGWVESATGRTLTSEQVRCVKVLRAIEQPYNLPLIGSGWSSAEDYSPHRDDGDDAAVLPAVEFADTWMIVRLFGSLATYDFANLTRLVLAAHEHAVRVEVRAETYLAVDTESHICELVDGKWRETDEHPSYPRTCLELQLNARQREGRGWERHPTIEQVIDPTLGGQEARVTGSIPISSERR